MQPSPSESNRDDATLLSEDSGLNQVVQRQENQVYNSTEATGWQSSTSSDIGDHCLQMYYSSVCINRFVLDR